MSKPAASPSVSKSGYDVTPLDSEKVSDLAASLPPATRRIVLEQGTEYAFTGMFSQLPQLPQPSTSMHPHPRNPR